MLPNVEYLRIFAENDASGTNERALLECRERWVKAGRKVSAIRPRAGFNDLNDEWQNPPRELAERTEDFLAICNRFWPGAELTSHTDPSVVSTLKEIGLAAFGLGQDSVVNR